MLTFLALIGFPKWQALSRDQRRIVWRYCVQPLITHWRARAARLAFALLVLVIAWLLGGFDRTGSAILAVVAVILSGDLVELVVVVRARRKIARYIEEHAAELKSAA
jgi:hypothetical protein